MTSRDFAFWLQGYFEILDPSLEAAPFPLGPAQVKSIRDHLQLVFTHDINPRTDVMSAYAKQAIGGGVMFTSNSGKDILGQR